MSEIQKIMENEEFLQGLVEVETPAQLGELFAKNGIELEEGLSLEKAFELVKAQENAELNEDALDDVNGGIGLLVGLGAAASLTFAAGVVCFISGYAYQKYKNAKKKKK